MKVINLNDWDGNDFIVHGKARFSDDRWRIEISQSEHVVFDFGREIGDSSHLSDYPDLKQFAKFFCYCTFPKYFNPNITSWGTTQSLYNNLVWVLSNFFYEHQLTTSKMLCALTAKQLAIFINNHITLAESTRRRGTLTSLTSIARFFSAWSEMSERKHIPQWARLRHDLSLFMPDDVSAKLRRMIDDLKTPWTPIEPDVVKACFDEASAYIYEYSSSIIEAQEIIRNRPRHNVTRGDAPYMPVREDGASKEMFKQLSSLVIPLTRGAGPPLFELPITTRKVSSKGYARGWQHRTTMKINEIRPEVINLKRACIFIIGLFTGMRRREIASLKANPAYLKNGSFYLDIVRYKTSHDAEEGTPDSIPISKSVADAVNILIQLFHGQRTAYESDYLLISDIPSKKGFEKVKLATIGKDVRAFCSQFGGCSAHTHQLRKTIAWLLISRGEANVDLIRQLFGHKSYGMTLRYIMRNALITDSVVELIEHNYTEDLKDALLNISNNEPVSKDGQWYKASSRIEDQKYKGEIMASDIERFIHDSLRAGAPIYVARIPIGAFCVRLDDLETTKPPCMESSNCRRPEPEFCNYKRCKHAVFSGNAIENLNKQIEYYKTKLSYISAESGDEKLIAYYEAEIDEHIDLIETVVARNSTAFDGIEVSDVS